MNDQIEVNRIKEIYPGHYFVLLDFPTKEILYDIIDLSYKYIWGVNHVESGVEWKEYSYELFGKSMSKDKVITRNMQFEYVVSTADFIKLIPDISQSVNIIQTNIIPPSYLNLEKLKGKSRYHLLKEKVDYLFELEMPGAIDYAPIISPNREFLNNIIKKIK